MRVLHVLGSMDPAAGGPPAVVARLAAAQTQLLQPAGGGGVGAAGGEVRVLSHASPGRASDVHASLAGIPGVEEVQFRTVPPDLRFGFLLPETSRQQLRELVSRSDVLHLHGIWDPLVLWASREAQRAGVPYVVTPHGMLDPWSLKQRWLKKKVALLLVYGRMLKRAKGFHVLNEDEAALMAPLRLPAAKHVIPNGVFLEEIEPLPPAGSFHARRPELRGRPFILFLSRLHYKKGLDYLAEAFSLVAAEHPEVQLVVAGPDGGAKAEFQARIARAGLTDRVHLVGSIYGREKFEALVDAACFCLPSRQEGFSMAITEALACGTPVVISENCHFPEVAETGAGEVVPLNALAVAGALRRVLGDADLRRRMGAAGRELVRSRYTWPVIAERALEMYRQARK